MKRNVYVLVSMLLVCLSPLSMRAIGSTPTNNNANTALVTGCEGITITGGAGSIILGGLGTYSHIQVFTPGFATQVFNQEISTSSLTVPISAAGNYIVKVWSNPNPAAFCENNFPVTVGGGGGTPPVAVNDNVSTPQGTPISIAVLNNDNVNGALQSLTIMTNPLNGTASVNGNNILYTPRAGFSGTDAFMYKISNGNGTSSATVTITVPAQGQPPVAVNDNVSTPQGTPIAIAVLNNDNVNGALQSLTIMTNPLNGTASVNGNNIVYTPRAGFSGTDAFMYKISNGNGTSSATVTITVPAQGQPPVAVNDNATTNQNTSVTIPVLNNDNVNGALQIFVIMSNPANGTAVVNGSNIVYTPRAGFCGNDAFTYKINNGIGSSIATVNVTVNCPVDPCANDVTPPSITCPANMTKNPTDGKSCWTNITWSTPKATDNCSTPTVRQIAGPTSGSCIGYGVSTVTYQATDARGNTSTCSFTITINRPACNNPYIEFKNNTNCGLYIYCVDRYGRRTYHRSLKSGAWCSLSTAVGSKWLMCRNDGLVVHECVATSVCQQYCTATGCSTGHWLSTNDATTMNARAEVNRVQIGFVNNTGHKNDYFRVEKLSDVTGNFEKLETINNKATSTENEYYTTYDNEPSEGENTYRVVVNYVDGTNSTSAAQTVKFNGTSDIRLYPNPATDVVGIDLSKYKGQAVTVVLYNQFGQQVLTQQVEKATGTLNLDVSQNTTGNYRIRVVSKGKKDVIKQLHITK
jgi:Bacterial Ig domain/HYR domain/Secretion system C-terminal sorting domain